ncbi:hypothetical protein [Aequorivita sp. CIP111184]|uniref:hypothetical protein n=1 Tax=Aequorivita sp. CIP111184 TaxID=2211356 RepID=UPI000DBBFF98|nr:hypothetical protein [Aequorivita sp. CIP111184]SRX55401.1 hypothetical protein AEQU1_02423 [Aequorivita sp. CIP111184]
MKKAILFIGTLFFLLMTMPSYTQKTSKKQEESKTKMEKIQKNTNSKVEEKGVSTPDHWHNPKNKSNIARLSHKLMLKNSAFQLKLNDNGFDLYENGSSKVYAKLVPTPKEGLYRYTSSTINGAAHFDAKGNLVLKYLDNDTGKMKEIQFQSN